MHGMMHGRTARPENRREQLRFSGDRSNNAIASPCQGTECAKHPMNPMTNQSVTLKESSVFPISGFRHRLSLLVERPRMVMRSFAQSVQPPDASVSAFARFGAVDNTGHPSTENLHDRPAASLNNRKPQIVGVQQVAGTGMR